MPIKCISHILVVANYHICFNFKLLRHLSVLNSVIGKTTLHKVSCFAKCYVMYQLFCSVSDWFSLYSCQSCCFIPINPSPVWHLYHWQMPGIPLLAFSFITCVCCIHILMMYLWILVIVCQNNIGGWIKKLPWAEFQLLLL